MSTGRIDVALDARRAAHAAHTGIGRYVREIAAAVEVRDDVALRRLSSSRAAFDAPLRKMAWEQRTLVRAAAASSLLHAPYYEVSPAAGRRLVLNVHDLDTVDAPERYSWRSRTYLNHLLRPLVRRARRVIVPSTHTADRIEAVFGAGSKTDVIPYGVDDVFRQPAAAPSDHPPFVLYSGGYAHRKDVPSLLAVFGELVRRGYDGQLVLSGGPWPQDVVLAELPDVVRRRVRFTGRVTDAALRDLYAEADLLLYPSLMEGFGFPVVEAMSAGCPVVATTAGSLPELAGDACLLSAPGDRPALVEHAERVLRDDELRRRLTAAGRRQAERFTWPRAAELTVRTYRAALS